MTWISPDVEKQQRNKRNRDRFMVELNADERSDLEQAKLALNIKSDSKCMKILMVAGKNAIIPLLNVKDWRYLMRRDRQRLSEYIDLEKAVTQNANP